MTIPNILKAVKHLGFAVFEQGNFNLNIIGVRNSVNEPDKFNDHIYIVYKENNNWVELIYNCTTEAGVYYLNNPSRTTGTAVLVHDKQYRGAYKLGLHRGKYKALTQTGAKVSIWRDNNKDDVADYGGPIYEGYFGINIHRASLAGSETIGRYSAGCQVLNNIQNYDRLISLCEKQIANGHGDTFSYTLLLDETLERSLVECLSQKSSKLPSKSASSAPPSSKNSVKKSRPPARKKAPAAEKSQKPKNSK